MRKIFKRIGTPSLAPNTDTPRTTLTSFSATSSTESPVGYETLFEGAAPIIADIVFIHGLRGHRRETWMKEGICWPKDLLPREEALSNVRILTFGYDLKFGGHASLNSLFKHSISLVNGLCRERDDSVRPIIFVAHSLGGLLVKDALHHSDIHRITQPELSTILDATRGIVFLGTPHRGSGAATLLESVTSVIRAFREENVDLIRDLERDSQTLDRIGVSFGQILDRQKFTVFSFEEELAMKGTKVVDGGSAIIGDARERRDTIHADHVNMVKFSEPTDDGYRKVLYAIKFLLRVMLHSAGQGTIALLPVSTYYSVPPLHVHYYVERKGLFARLEELLSSRTSPRQQIVVLLGMGGTGKTQLALKYCRHMKSNGNFRAIFWLDASSRNALESSMVTISRQLVPGRIVQNSRDAVELVRTTLSSWSDPWLLVFDNFDNPSELPDLMEYFPDSSCGSILITSRSVESRRLGAVVELDQMEKNEALELLLHSSQTNSKDQEMAEKILTRLGYLPLAIDQAGAYISRRRLRLVDFEEEYDMRKRNFMKETPRIWQYRRARLGTDSLLTTWEMSFRLLDADMEHDKLGDILTLFAFPHPVNISEEVFKANVDANDLAGSPMGIFVENGERNHEKFERAVIFMQDHSLVRFSQRSRNEIVVSLHSMVSEWLRLRLDEGTLRTFLKIVSRHLKHYLKSVQLDYVNAQEALSHLDSICGIAELAGENNEFTEFYVGFGRFYAKHDRLNDAERIYGRALAGYEKAWGPEHTSTLDTVNDLANLYRQQGRLADAERMYDRALAGKEVAWGSEHTPTLDTVTSLGTLYRQQGRLADAERMYDRALAGYERAWGPGHTSTLNTVNNLGLLYVDQGRLADAERMYDRALVGKEAAWGLEHTSTLDIVHNLGILYANQGRLADAERMYNRALAGYEIALGPEHTFTLGTVDNLGLLYIDQGRLADAERMYNRALVGKEKALGPEHTSTLHTVNNFGILYRKQRRLADTKRMYDRALAGYERALGPGHTSTLNTVNNLGLLYVDQGRLADAERMYDRALAGYENALHPEHTSTLNTVNNLALLYADQGRLADAERMYKRALAGYEIALGPKHTSTLDTVNNLGVLYSDQGRLADAERMYDRALAGYEKALGPEHTSTLDTVNNFGILYRKQRRLADAERMYKRALAGYEKVSGPEHTSTLNTVNNFGLLYADQGRLADAERMYDRALAEKEKVLGPEHTSTLVTVNNLGLLYACQGRLADAERMYKRASVGFETALGPKHPSTLTTINNLNTLYSQQGHLAEEERM